jgi:hypothetical protein
MASGARVRALIAVLVVLLLAGAGLAELPGVAGRVGQAAVIVGMMAVVGLLAAG